MTRKLETSDVPAVLDLVRREPSLNIWIIADLENYGLETDFLDLWGFFAGSALRAVVLRFHSHFVAYSADNELPGGLVAVLTSPELKSLSGRATTLKPVAEELGCAEVTLKYLAGLTPASFRSLSNPSLKVEFGSIADSQGLHDLASHVAEFAGGTAEDMRGRLSNPRARTYLIRQDSHIVSAASTTVECSTSAMIGGVMTHPGYRGRGLASACLSKLCHDLLDAGKVCCLTYYNPEAGRIYARLGFTVVSPWILAKR